MLAETPTEPRKKNPRPVVRHKNPYTEESASRRRHAPLKRRLAARRRGGGSPPNELPTADSFQRLAAEQARLLRERDALVRRLRRALELESRAASRGEYLDTTHELELLDRRLAGLDERLERAASANEERHPEPALAA